jgi:hypothetical protein
MEKFWPPRNPHLNLRYYHLWETLKQGLCEQSTFIARSERQNSTKEKKRGQYFKTRSVVRCSEDATGMLRSWRSGI